MAKFDVVNQQNKKVGSIDLADAVFAADVKEHLLWEVVNAQRAGKRAGTQKAKTKGEVRGGGAKPYKQKGTGRARRGSSRTPLTRGGGVSFAPLPRSYAQGTPKQVKAGALRSAVSLRARDQKLVIVKDLELKEIKTKKFAGVLATLAAPAALVVDGENNALDLSARNLPDVKVLRPEGLNVYDILRYPSLVVTETAVKAIEARLTPKVRRSAGNASPSAAA